MYLSSIKGKWSIMSESRIDKCEVCGNEGEVFVRASSLAPASFAYCKRCLDKGVEPYFLIMQRLWLEGSSLDDFSEKRQEAIKELLNIYGVSIDTFNKDLIEYRKRGRFGRKFSLLGMFRRFIR